MQRKTRRLIIAVALIGALAAGGAAFTAAIGTPSVTNSAGFATETVTQGQNVVSQSKTLSNDGSLINSVSLTFASAQTNTAVVKAGYQDETQLDTCSTTDHTTYTCTMSHGTGSAGAEPTAGATSFNVAVTDN